MDFAIPPDLGTLQERTRDFIRGSIIPMEKDSRQTRHGPSDALRRELNAMAAGEGLLAPHVSSEFGGLGLSHVGKAMVFEEAGYSVLGPLAMNVSAPDEGNMHLLEAVATPAQKERWLRPLASGAIRSCFCMTEPPPGAGSDPAALATTAVRDGGDYVINGTEMVYDRRRAGRASPSSWRAARTARRRCSSPTWTGPASNRADDGYARPGVRGRPRDRSLHRFACARRRHPRRTWPRIPLRAGAARAGAADPLHALAGSGSTRARYRDGYARTREAFGRKLGEHEGVGFMLADNEMDIRTSRLTIWHTAWLLDQGERAGTESSIAKVVCSEAIWRVADRCVQVLGGQGVTVGDAGRAHFSRSARVPHL